MAVWRFYSNVAVQDTCAASLGTGTTSLVTGSGAPVGYPASFPFTLRLDPGTASEELVSVTSGSGTSGTPWVITRGYDGTTAKTHSAGAVIQHSSSAGDYGTAATHYNQGSGSGVHGLPASAWATAVVAKIQDTLLANSTTSVVTFSSIPSTYLHLLLIAQGRLTETSVQSDDILLQFNSDSSASYGYVTQFATNPSGTLSSSQASGSAGTSMPSFRFTASQAGSPVNAGGGFLFIPNYAATAFNKLIYGVTGGGNGTTSFVDVRSRVGIWNPASQAAVSAISLTAPSANYLTGSRFTLYGVS